MPLICFFSQGVKVFASKKLFWGLVELIVGFWEGIGNGVFVLDESVWFLVSSAGDGWLGVNSCSFFSEEGVGNGVFVLDESGWFLVSSAGDGWLGVNSWSFFSE